MQSPIPGYLAGALAAVEPNTSGEVADYIPELASADPDRLGVAVVMSDGYLYAAGDTDIEFSIQSISKPFVYALALADRGFDEVLGRVGVEPTGDAFNEISLEPGTGRPRNPMINAGAITTHTLVGDPWMSETSRSDRVLDGLSDFAGRRLHLDERVFESEMETSFRNRALANMLRANDVIGGEPLVALAGYTRQCSVRVTTRDLAVMAATLANQGVNPMTGERVVPADVVRQTLSVMATCGMYDGAGDWMTRVGVPAKSGVSGGLIGALPGQVGIATFSPRLDRHGNSVRGTELFARFTHEMNLHLMGASSAPTSVIRSIRVIDDGREPIYVMSLQGYIQFSSSERVCRELELQPPVCRRVALDLSRVSALGEGAHQLLWATVHQLVTEGFEVFLIDEEQRIDEEITDGAAVSILASIDDIS